MFYKDIRRHKAGLMASCKCCHNVRVAKWQTTHKERTIEITKQWQKTHRERCKAAVRRYEKCNPERVKEWNLRSRKAHPEGAAKRRDKQRSTPSGKLNNNISAVIRASLKGNKGGRHWEKLVGYTINDLMEHLENLFQPGMTWENQGKWHIDHKIPKVFFRFGNPEDPDFKLCWNLNNLQPLWALDNLRKQTKIIYAVAVGG